MSNEPTRFDDELARLQGLIAALEGLSDENAKRASRELVQAVLNLHAAGIKDILGIVDEAGSQPADTLLARFAANPRVCGLLLLHDLHPEDLSTRARKAVERLRPHLGVYGIRAEFTGTDSGTVHVRVSAGSPAGNHRQTSDALRREIEDAVMAMTPDARALVIDGLESIDAAAVNNEVLVPMSSITGRTTVRRQVSAAGD